MNAFRTVFRTNFLYGKDLFEFIVSCLFTNIIQWTSQTNGASPDAQSLCKRDDDGSVYVWEGGKIYTSPSTTGGTHGYNSEWIKNDDWKTREEKIKPEMEGEIEVGAGRCTRNERGNGKVIRESAWTPMSAWRTIAHDQLANFLDWTKSSIPDQWSSWAT